MRRTIVVSDLTGAEFSAADDAKPVEVLIGGRGGHRDLTPEETAVLAEWAETGDAAALRALLARTVPAVRPGRPGTPRGGAPGRDKRADKKADARNAAIRAWARTTAGRAALGLPAAAKIPSHGRLPRKYIEAYDACMRQSLPAHPAANTGGETG